MTRLSPLRRAVRLAHGLILLLSFVLPVHGAGHAMHLLRQGEAHLAQGGEGGSGAHGGEVGDQGAPGPEDRRAHEGHHGVDARGDAHADPSEDSGRGTLPSCCTGPCVCPPLPSAPSPRGVVVRIAVEPSRPCPRSGAAQAPAQAPIPHVLPFSTAPPLSV